MSVARADRGWRYRTGIGVRALVALLGSYGLAALAATVLARTLATDRLSASVWATLAGLVLPVPVVLGVFLCRSATRAVVLSLAAAAVLTLLIWSTGRPA